MNRCIAILALLGFTSCHRQSAPPPIPPTKVNADLSLSCNVPIYLEAVGNLTSVKTVSVQSQVEGELSKIHFTDGQLIKEGNLLFTIDPRPYLAALQQAEANLAVNIANLKLAKETAQRYARLVNQDYVSKLDWDQYVTNVEIYEATVKSNQAQVANAKINLDYCYIQAPFDGITGRHFVDEGNLIQNGGATLVVLNQLDPIYVDFSIPEKNLAKVKEHQTTEGLIVEITAPGYPHQAFKGRLIVIENAVDENTGMIVLRALLNNSDYKLWPGQFVKVKLILFNEPESVVIPESALNIGQKGYYVYVIKEDLTAEMRLVSIGQRMGPQVQIKSGIKAGERVITNGQINVRNGGKVEISTRAGT